MEKLMIIVIFGTIIAFSTFSLSMNDKMSDAFDNAVTQFERVTTRNIVNSVMGIGMRQLQDSSSWRDGYNDISFDGGNATLTVGDTVISGESLVVISCTATFGEETATTRTVVRPPSPDVPAIVRGSLTAFGPVNNLVSDMIIDGRNHDEDENVIPGTGTYGVSTGDSVFVNIDNAQIGGTYNIADPPTDYVPAFPETSLVIEVNAPWPDGWPTTPDEALGLEEGTLIAIAMSGIGGSRYIDSNDPNDLENFPIKGVTYVDVPPGTEWKSKKLSSKPKGILIFHSSNTDAYWETIKTVDDTPFKGMMLFDRVFHVHMDILGAVVHISPNTVTDKTCNGNADHWMYYSEQVILDALDVAGIETLTSEGSWAETFEILSWWE